MKKLLCVLIISGLILAGCAVSPTGRHQLLLVSDSEIDQMGQQAFEQMRKEGEFINAPREKAFARCVTQELTKVLPAPWNGQAWQVEIIKDDTPNAFALPGGRIGVNMGMFKLTDNQDLLAVVLGHEIGHVIAKHSAERMSRGVLSDLGVAVVSGSQGINPEVAAQIFGIGFMLPFSRTQESEADTVGQQYMAQAGFDPRAAVTLWQRMQKESGGSGPSFLSTHPSPSQRISKLESGAQKLLPTYEAARQKHSPTCKL